MFHQNLLVTRCTDRIIPAEGPGATAAPKRPAVLMPDEYLPPNRILFVQNLPAETITKEALTELFSQYVVYSACVRHN